MSIVIKVSFPTMNGKKVFVSLRGITKTFPGVVANDHIDLDIYSEEIHALLGENGAGKSTLMKILYGFYRADSGQVLIDGETVPIHSPHDARAFRIGMVFQDFTLIPAFTVADNISLFLPDLKGVLYPKEIDLRIEEMSVRYELRVDPRARVSQLSVGEQQKVEILKLLLSNARLLILDEPTRVLAPHEVESLFKVLDNLRKDGYAIVLITHKLKEVLACADRITVLRAGQVASSLLRSEADEDKLISLMFEKRLAPLQVNRNVSVSPSDTPVLELAQVWTRSQGLETGLKAIDLKIFPGEIVGVAGVSGNGQKELGDVVLGMIRCEQGSKFLFGQDSTSWSIQKVRRSGVAFIPENPRSMSIAPFMSVIQNMALTRTDQYSRLGGILIDWQAVRADADSSMERLDFSFPLNVPARTLSGGTMQRMVIVREITGNPRLIIASYLTRGLDVQSAIAARQSLLHARNHGAGVLLISEDLDELLALSDRLIVLYNGKIVSSFKTEGADVYEIGHLMTGSKVRDVSNH